MVSRWSAVGRVRAGMGTAVLAVGLSVAAVPALAVAPAVATASLVDWSSDGYGGWSPGGQEGYGQQRGASTTPSTSPVNSEPATSSQSKGVVLVDTELGYENAAGAGTGIVLTADGEVVTNYHVVEGATAVKVTVASTGKSYTATVVGHSATTDVALLQLTNASGLTTATVDDDTLGTGDTVTAVGNAQGTGTLTAARGTVTDLSTSITTASEGSVAAERLTGLIETSADLVPGDSGGPLVDGEGEVVGLDVAASNGSSSATIDGYAIPISDALAVVQQILTGGSTSTVQVGAKAYLGVQVTDSASLYPGASFDTGSAYGGADVAAVVDGSPAAKAGLAAGDTITAVGSTAVTSASGLSSALGRRTVGDHVRIAWTDAAGSTHHAGVTLAASPTA